MIAATLAAAFSLTATPARVELNGAGKQVVQIRNEGGSRVVLDVSRAGFALDLNGRPRVIAAKPAPWLSARPKLVAVPAGGTASLTVTGRVPRGSTPGDHTALLLLSTRPLANARVAVRLRLGVIVVLRVPGRVVHGVAVQALRVARMPRVATFNVALANRGNVVEQLRGRVSVSLWRGDKLLARLRPAARELLPQSRGILRVRLRTTLRGAVVAQVVIQAAKGTGTVVSRRFRAVL